MIRAAAYCRVSTDHLDQANSFTAQKTYFREYIRRMGWEETEIYADEGITGTSTRNRTQFNRMMADASQGRFQRIVTKEVSRFSRNILDTISCTRELKRVGVSVLFLNDGIDTAQPDAELRLSIMASIAQEESRKTSSRVTWGQTRQMEKGVVFGRSLLGYDVRKGSIRVNPRGAEIVRLIFHQYAVMQKGPGAIAKLCNERALTTLAGSAWTAGAVIRVLKNEKYTGDLIQKKTFTPDYLTHEKKKNTGQVPFVILRNHHEPIIPREIWDAAQNRLMRNNKHCKKGGCSSHYAFSGKIRCGECGSVFVCRQSRGKEGRVSLRWCCSRALREGKARCSVGKLVRDEDAREMLMAVTVSLKMNWLEFQSQLTEKIQDANLMQRRQIQENEAKISTEIGRTEKKLEDALDYYVSRELTGEELTCLRSRYKDKIRLLKGEISKIKQQNTEENPEITKEKISNCLMELLAGEGSTDVLCRHLVETITVFRDRHVELKLNFLDEKFCFIESEA